MEEQKSNIRTIIEKKIAASGKTKREITELAGINSGNLNKMIDSPSWPTLERVASAIGIPVSELVSDEPHQDAAPLMRCPRCGQEIKVTLE